MTDSGIFEDSPIPDVPRTRIPGGRWKVNDFVYVKPTFTPVPATIKQKSYNRHIRRWEYRLQFSDWNRLDWAIWYDEDIIGKAVK